MIALYDTTYDTVIVLTRPIYWLPVATNGTINLLTINMVTNIWLQLSLQPIIGYESRIIFENVEFKVVMTDSCR